jgi:hypothetical protein
MACLLVPQFLFLCHSNKNGETAEGKINNNGTRVHRFYHRCGASGDIGHNGFWHILFHGPRVCLWQFMATSGFLGCAVSRVYPGCGGFRNRIHLRYWDYS